MASSNTPEFLKASCFEYVYRARKFGFPTQAIHFDLHRTGKIAPDLSLDQFEKYFSNGDLSVNRRTYPKTAEKTAYRFIHYACRHTTRPDEIYRLGVARGFTWTSPDVVERCMICHNTTMASLRRGRNGNLSFDRGNSSRTIPDREWEDAVVTAYALGYTAHEIDYFSMKQWYLDSRDDGTPRGFASNYTRVAKIITANAFKGRTECTNLDWSTDENAKGYVLAAFSIGISIADIVAQLHIHWHKIYEVTEKVVIKFLKEMDVI